MLNEKAMALAFAGAAAVLFALCSLLVFAMPHMMMDMTGHMTHADFSDMHWTLSGTGLLFGLLAWTVSAAALGWLLAFLYNRIASPAAE